MKIKSELKIVEKEQIKKELDWSSIPVFPADGSILWWKDTLVVRLSK